MTVEYCPKENHINIIMLICLYLIGLFLTIDVFYEKFDVLRYISIAYTVVVGLYSLFILYKYFMANDCFNFRDKAACKSKPLCKWNDDQQICVKMFKHRLSSYVVFLSSFIYLIIFGVKIIDQMESMPRITIISGTLGILFCIADFIFC